MRRKLLLCLLLLSPLSIYFFLRDSSDAGHLPIDPENTSPLTPDQHQVLACLAIFPGQSFPAAIPWAPYFKIGQQETAAFDQLAKDDPLEFLERCLKQYKQEVQGYRCVFDKQERVKGKLREPESILVHFTQKPFCVHMDWLSGADPVGAHRTLYCKEEDENLLHVRVGNPKLPFRVVLPKALNDTQVTDTSRFGIDKFGMYYGAKGTIDAMREIPRDKVHVKFEGKAPVKEAGNRVCYKFVRTPYDPPEERYDDCNELVIYIDAETHLQVGSILKNSKGELIAYYFFHNIKLNPEFHEDQFTRKKL